MDGIIRSAPSFIARPFSGIAEIGSCLSETVLRIGDSVQHPGWVELSRELLPLENGVLEIYFSSDLLKNLDTLGLQVDDVRLAVIAEGSVIADSEVIFCEPITALSSPVVVQLSGSPLIFQSPNGFDVSILLVVNQRQEKTSPNLEKGVWLALEQFQIAPFSTQNMFAPIPLDEQLRSAIGAPRGCLSFVRTSDEIITAENLEDHLEVYVDLEILRLLHEDPSAPLSHMIQMEVAVSVYSLIVLKVANQVRGMEVDFQRLGDLLHLPVGQILSSVSASNKIQVETLIEIATSEPGLLKAMVEDHLRVLKIASAALREVS